MTKIIDDKSNINYEIYIGQFINATHLTIC